MQAGPPVVVFFIHVSALLDQVRRHLEHAHVSRIKERMFDSVLTQRCLDLLVLVLDRIIAVFSQVESGSAVVVFFVHVSALLD